MHWKLDSVFKKQCAQLIINSGYLLMISNPGIGMLCVPNNFRCEENELTIELTLASMFLYAQEMCTLGIWTVDKWRPLQELLLPVVLNKR